MSSLSVDELSFLMHHNLCEADVFDGRWQSKAERERSAKELGKHIILSSIRCRNAGHRLRTRAGHCVQCKPANLAFSKRDSSAAYVYIAGSRSNRLLKFGVAKDTQQRQRQLRSESYGGCSDWKVLVHVHLPEAGRIEREAASYLAGANISREYFKDGIIQVATELLRCSFSEALKALSRATGGILNRAEIEAIHRDYEFDSHSE